MTNNDKQFADLVSVVAPAKSSTPSSPSETFAQSVGALLSTQSASSPDAAAATTAAANGSGGALAQNTQQLSQLVAALENQLNATTDNTRAVSDNTTAKSSSAASTAGSLLTNIFGGALSMAPIISGLMSLFGGSSSEAPAAVTKFALPPALNLQASVSSAQGVTPASYSQDGLPRPAGSNAPQPSQVTVNIQALDSRSFLDRSSDIADAVKQALLNSHSLSDVIGEL